MSGKNHTLRFDFILTIALLRCELRHYKEILISFRKNAGVVLLFKTPPRSPNTRKITFFSHPSHTKATVSIKNLVPQLVPTIGLDSAVSHQNRLMFFAPLLRNNHIFKIACGKNHSRRFDFYTHYSTFAMWFAPLPRNIDIFLRKSKSGAIFDNAKSAAENNEKTMRVFSHPSNEIAIFPNSANQTLSISIDTNPF